MNKKFLVCKKQENHGCDYTIGCGMTYDVYIAPDRESLIETVLYPDGPAEGSILEDEGNPIVEILVIDFDDVEKVEVSTIREDIAAWKEKERLDAERAADEAEYERLKKKLGK